ncbi:nitroreductase family deazaflavin-dependent oxidoreductase [Aldersonia kunmingensis]|uniref:nitroreductase family deazaflavin-dependent oxidoreductase n=1 Tax=Aldersonia kunmingensis TaxID=408066 RepID=UPI001470A106|nr:nitroreductase family deazaflavin-dependent oxidoreductase [Aldersonia kunmingensis]
MARFNKAVTNKLAGPLAPYVLPWAVVEHRGRKTGTEYSTVVVAFRRGDLIAIPLPYGPQTQWLHNLIAAGKGSLRRRGRVNGISDFRVVDRREAQVPLGAAVGGRLTGRVLLAQLERRG